MCVFTFNRRSNVKELSLGEHEKELLHRLVASGVDDAEFLKRFFERHEIESELIVRYQRRF
jgi:hypothetical protein